MIISSSTPGAIASSVWAQTTRQLSSLGSGVFVLVTQADTTVAASGSVDLRPVAGRTRELSVGLAAGAAGAISLNMYDGTQTRTLTQVTSGTNGACPVILGSSVAGGRLVNNDASNAAHYMYSGQEWIQ